MAPYPHRRPNRSTARRARRWARLALALGTLITFGLGAKAGLGAFGAEVGPPTPRIASAPPKTTASRAATFGVDSAPSTTLECSLDGSSFRRCAARTTYRRLALGSHTFQVRARSALGHTGGTAAYEWRVLPRRTLSSPLPVVPRPILRTMPTRPFVSPNATFAWRPRGATRWQPGTTFSCSLDGRAWKRCRAPISYRGLRSGRHVFRVRAKHDGRYSRKNSFTWNIELSLPGTPTVSRIAVDPPTDAAFEFEASGAAGYECRLDGGPWTPCSSPVELAGVAPGQHELCVRALSSESVPGLPSCVAWTESESAPPPPPDPPPTVAQFSIEGDLPALLAPGSSGPLPLVISNPNGFAILVSELVVTVDPGSSRPGCDGPSNLAVTQSNAAVPGLEVLVPANGSVTLPTQSATAPVVEMLDLPTNQDACKGAVFSLSYSGTARTP